MTAVEQVMKDTDVKVLEKERDYNNLSMEEARMLKREVIKMTLEEFAKKYEGDQLSILYRNGYQRGFVRTSDIGGRCTPFSTNQDIILDVEHPDDGLVIFNLKDYR